jgi:hypothetical protein
VPDPGVLALSGIMTRVQRVRAGCLVAALIAVLSTGAALVFGRAGPAGRASGSPAQSAPLATRPVLAPMPSPPLVTPTVTLTRIGPSGIGQIVAISPDGQWMFTPYRGSARASVINHGRLTVTEHVALAGTLASAGFRSEAGEAPGQCHGGTSYRLTAGRVDAIWTECDAGGRPVLTDLLDRIVAFARF